MSDRIRTGDRLDHNQELYQLSYAHHGATESNSDRELRALSRLDHTPQAWQRDVQIRRQ